MTAATLLRVGIHLLGVYALFTGLMSGVYYGYHALRNVPTEFGTGVDAPAIFGYACVPLLFALACFGFAGKITRLLLGSRGDESIQGNSTFVRVAVKVLGLYFAGLYGAPLVATIFELAAVRSGNTAFSNEQVTSDLISNALGIAFAAYLLVRTDRVLRLFSRPDDVPR